MFFDKLFDWGSFEFGRWQVRVLGGNLVFYGFVCRVMRPLMMRLAQVAYLLPDGSVGIAGVPSRELRAAYEEVWRVVEILRLVGGSPHWWDATFSGSVASTMSLRERLPFSCAEECLIWVGGGANMNGVAAGSWSDGVYAIVRTEDWAEAIMSVVIHDFGTRRTSRGAALGCNLGVSLPSDDCNIMCGFVVESRCALRHRQLSRAAVGHTFASSTRLWQLHLWPAVVDDGAVQI